MSVRDLRPVWRVATVTAFTHYCKPPVRAPRRIASLADGERPPAFACLLKIPPTTLLKSRPGQSGLSTVARNAPSLLECFPGARQGATLTAPVRQDNNFAAPIVRTINPLRGDDRDFAARAQAPFSCRKFISMRRVHVRPAIERSRQLLRGSNSIEHPKDKQVPCQLAAISALRHAGCRR